jgi:hypothetical protein
MSPLLLRIRILDILTLLLRIFVEYLAIPFVLFIFSPIFSSCFFFLFSSYFLPIFSSSFLSDTLPIPYSLLSIFYSCFSSYFLCFPCLTRSSYMKYPGDEAPPVVSGGLVLSGWVKSLTNPSIYYFLPLGLGFLSVFSFLSIIFEFQKIFGK